VLAVALAHTLFQLTGLARAIRSGKGSTAVGRSPVGLVVAKHLGVGVSQRHKDHAVVGKEGNGRETNGFLTAALRARRKKAATRLAHEFAALPQRAGRIHKGLDLGGHHAVAAAESKQESVKLLHFVGRHDGIVRLGGRPHLGQNFVAERLGHLEDGAFGAIGGFDALLDGFRHGGDVAVHGVNDNGNLGHCGCRLNGNVRDGCEFTSTTYKTMAGLKISIS